MDESNRHLPTSSSWAGLAFQKSSHFARVPHHHPLYQYLQMFGSHDLDAQLGCSLIMTGAHLEEYVITKDFYKLQTKEASIISSLSDLLVSLKTKKYDPTCRITGERFIMAD